MSKLDRKQLQRLILQEFKMMGMAPMSSIGVMGMNPNPHGCDSCGHSPCGCDEYVDAGEETHLPMQPLSHGSSHKGSVSREDCCAAVMCLVECCSCPITKAALIECCNEIMAGHHDH